MSHQRFFAVALIAAAAIALAAALGVPGLAYLPIAVLLLACLLMMVFMKRGMSHGDHSSHDEHTSERSGTLTLAELPLGEDHAPIIVELRADR